MTLLHYKLAGRSTTSIGMHGGLGRLQKATMVSVHALHGFSARSQCLHCLWRLGQKPVIDTNGRILHRLKILPAPQPASLAKTGIPSDVPVVAVARA